MRYTCWSQPKWTIFFPLGYPLFYNQYPVQSISIYDDKTMIDYEDLETFHKHPSLEYYEKIMEMGQVEVRSLLDISYGSWNNYLETLFNKIQVVPFVSWFAGKGIRDPAHGHCQWQELVFLSGWTNAWLYSYRRLGPLHTLLTGIPDSLWGDSAGHAEIYVWRRYRLAESSPQ